MAGSGASRYKVILRPNAMERVKERLSRSDIWGLKKRGREEWKVEVQFHNRTHSFFDGNRPRRYNRGEFDAVVIFYDPRSPRKTFELVWTKWLPEIRHFLPETPITLAEVGNGKEKDWVISSEEGIRVAKGVGASFVRWPRETPMPTVTRLAKVTFIQKFERLALQKKVR